MTRNSTTRFGGGLGPLPRLVLAAAVLFPLASCDSIMDVEDPDVTRPEALFEESNLPALRATVIGDFGVAYAGSGSSTTNIGLTHVTGLLTDEIWHSGTYGQNRELDKRQVGNTNSLVTSTVRNLYRARRSAQLGLEAYAQFRPNTAQHAEMANIEGLVYTAFAENFCGAIPFSTETNGAFEYGAPETTQQVFERAVGSFDQGLQIATASGTSAAALAQQRVARLGKARVLLDLNRYAEAAALVSGIPTSFVYAVEHSDNTTRQNNGIWGNNWGRREVALASNEGINGVDFRRGTATAQNVVVDADPRLPWSFRNGAADTRSIHHFQHKYPSQAANTPVLTGIEARLIEAEAALNRGQSAAYLPILNALRAGVGLAALTDPGTAAARVDQFFAERAMWLWGTAHRLSDLRRLVRQYGRPANSVFPTGAYIRPGVSGPRAEGTYGNDVSLPMLFDEENNINFDESQCVTTQA